MEPISKKSTVEQIRRRFDNDVERFSNLEAGHVAALDSRLAMELIAQAAASVTPQARHVLDIGCGAGNYTLKLLQYLPGLDVSLIDLSLPMLQRAGERIRAATTGSVTALQTDVRAVDLGRERYDIILAAAVFHHLRTEAEWRAVFGACHAALKPGGALWIFDMVEHDLPALQRLMRARYAAYLEAQKGIEYRQQVFAYIEEEDTPRSLNFQLRLLQEAGFDTVEVLHKNALFAAFGGLKTHA